MSTSSGSTIARPESPLEFTGILETRAGHIERLHNLKIRLGAVITRLNGLPPDPHGEETEPDPGSVVGRMHALNAEEDAIIKDIGMQIENLEQL